MMNYQGVNLMTYRIELSSQGGKPYAYHVRPSEAQAIALAETLQARHKALVVTVRGVV